MIRGSPMQVLSLLMVFPVLLIPNEILWWMVGIYVCLRRTFSMKYIFQLRAVRWEAGQVTEDGAVSSLR